MSKNPKLLSSILTNPEGEIIAYGNIDRVFITTLPSSDIITKTTTYNNHGELLTQSDNTLDDQLEVYGNNTYTYNDDGYLTQKTTPEGTTSYPYGTSGELKEVVTPTNTITYLHNAQNQRVAKLVDGNITEKYLWANLTTLLAIYDKDNNLLQRFTYTDNRMPISMINNGVKYYLHYNQIGTLKAVSNTNHNIVKQITYDTYGNILTDTNQTLKVPFRFAGGLYYTDTKLTRFGYRDYDAYTGKWTAKDPIGFAGRDSNLYGYVLGDPVNFVDPTGEIAWIPIILLVGGLQSWLSAPTPSSIPKSGATPLGNFTLACAGGGAYGAGKQNIFRIDPWGRWKNKRGGTWQKGPHFHLNPSGKNNGLMKHHLPQQWKGWWNNYKNTNKKNK